MIFIVDPVVKFYMLPPRWLLTFGCTVYIATAPPKLHLSRGRFNPIRHVAPMSTPI